MWIIGVSIVFNCCCVIEMFVGGCIFVVLSWVVYFKFWMILLLVSVDGGKLKVGIWMVFLGLWGSCFVGCWCGVE